LGYQQVFFQSNFDHFLDLVFGTIVDGATSGTVMGQKKFWVKPKMANSIETTLEVPGGFRWQIFSIQMKSESLNRCATDTFLMKQVLKI
jgi:hypothetical protein